MAMWFVTLPVCGVIHTEVDADSEDEAIEKAIEKRHQRTDLEDWDVHKVICEGNFFHGTQNEATAERADDEGEDG